MNCANHPDRERAAFCQNCGKPLCTECVRNVGTSVFCEPCLAARVGASVPPAGYGYSGPTAAYPPGVPPVSAGEPNPGLAALLGLIPGVGAMYNEQYAKGIVHLMVFAILVSLAHDSGIFGLFIAGWIFYMAIEAHHTARARRDGTPLPNPFGLNDLSERLGFGKAWPSAVPHGAGPSSADPGPDPAAQAAPGGPSNVGGAAHFYPYAAPVSHWGAPQDAYSGVPPVPPTPPVPPVPPMPLYPDANVPYYRRFPTGAIWLIVLGVFFLVGDTGIFHIFHTRLFGPFLLIGVGVWLFVRKMTESGLGLENDGSQDYHWRFARAVNCSFWVILTGAIWLLDVLNILRWSRSWPVYLIALGLLGLFKRTMHGGYGAYPPPGYGAPMPPATPPVTTAALVPLDPLSRSGDASGSDQEGR